MRSRIPIFIAVLAAALVVLAPASAQVPLVADLKGASSLAPGRATSYNVTVSGGPTGQVNYTIQWYVSGPDPAGALPLSSAPMSVTGNRSIFRLNVTAPTRDQTITLVVKISAAVGLTLENTSVEQSIVVITPIVLSATFRNAASTAATNVTVRFYIDDGFVGTQVIALLAANGQATATYDYLPVGLQPGSHQVRVEADLDGNGAIDPTRGETVVSDLFYRGTQGLSTGWTVLIAIGVFLPVLIATIALRRRRQA